MRFMSAIEPIRPVALFFFEKIFPPIDSEVFRDLGVRLKMRLRKDNSVA